MDFNSGGGTLQILTTSGGIPTSTVLASAPIAAGQSSFVTVDLGFAAISMTAGEVLAFVVFDNGPLTMTMSLGFIDGGTAL